MNERGDPWNSEEARQRRLRTIAYAYLEAVRQLFEMIQCSGFTMEQVKAEVVKIDPRLESVLK